MAYDVVARDSAQPYLSNSIFTMCCPGNTTKPTNLFFMSRWKLPPAPVCLWR